MTPFVQATWAPQGQTPVLSCRTRFQQGVSGIGALTLSPQRRRQGLYLTLHPAQAVCQDHILGFLRSLHRQLPGPKILLWDRLSVHRGSEVRAYLQAHPAWSVELLPAYAPELNPVEYLWSWLKRTELSNRCPQHLDDITDAVSQAVRPLRKEQKLLQGFVKATKLPLKFNLRH